MSSTMMVMMMAMTPSLNASSRPLPIPGLVYRREARRGQDRTPPSDCRVRFSHRPKLEQPVADPGSNPALRTPQNRLELPPPWQCIGDEDLAARLGASNPIRSRGPTDQRI